MSDRGLHLREVVVRYPGAAGPLTAVDRVSVHIAPGEVLALLGPSGCGKSSLLRAVAGLEPLASGTIRWDQDDLAGVPVHQRGFGLMFQDGQLFPHRDVAGNVAFGLQMARVRAADRRRRVHELLRLVGLDGYGARPVATLSGGERQRVALARSLAPAPRLLLLDEPLSALDRELRERLAEDLSDVLRRTGTTALFVTHDHDEAFTVADRVAVMDAGRVLQVDRPADLWHRPATRRVAQFLGYQAFVPVDTVDGVVRGGVLDGVAVGGGTGGHVVAVGAESVHVADAGPLTGMVQGTTFRQGRTRVTVDVHGLGTVPATWTRGEDPVIGDQVALRVDPGAVALLPGPMR